MSGAFNDCSRKTTFILLAPWCLLLHVFCVSKYKSFSYLVWHDTWLAFSSTLWSSLHLSSSVLHIYLIECLIFRTVLLLCALFPHSHTTLFLLPIYRHNEQFINMINMFMFRHWDRKWNRDWDWRLQRLHQGVAARRGTFSPCPRRWQTVVALGSRASNESYAKVSEDFKITEKPYQGLNMETWNWDTGAKITTDWPTHFRDHIHWEVLHIQ